MPRPTTSPPFMFWIIATLAVIWNLVEIYFSSIQLDLIRDSATPDELEKIESLPLWYTVVFLIALFAEMLGAFLLFMRRKIAVAFFGVAMVALIFIEFYWLFLFSIRRTSTTLSIVIPTLVVTIAVFLFFYSRYAARKNWIA